MKKIILFVLVLAAGMADVPVTVYFNYSHNLSDGCGDIWWARAGPEGATVLEPLETFQKFTRDAAKQNLRRAF